MNIITALVIIALAGAVSGYILRGIVRRRIFQLLAAGAGACTIPLLRFGAGFVPDWLLTMVPVLFAASIIILGSLFRDRAEMAVESPIKVTAATSVVLTLCSLFWYGIGMFFLGQESISEAPEPLEVLLFAAFAIIGSVGLCYAVKLALNRR